ncbi:MAG: exodeoxyribonuclease VII large subunit [Actinobacteria bacterium]|nr:exodeoxyribonuclease VII large subunit [Actinomycetota bacterium]
MPASNSVETPMAVSQVSHEIKNWIEKLGHVWVEGQITQVTIRTGYQKSFMTLRDISEDYALSITCPSNLIKTLMPDIAIGDRVVINGKPNFYPNRGSFSLEISDIRPVGLGELLARIEALRKMFAAEGLFDADRKVALPFLPRNIGLITGKASDAERDVLENTKRRWPGVTFTVINTAVQGATTVPQILKALEQLQADPTVDVIVIARGGGSAEDLLPFSDETLIRAVAACTIPVVSAIGHEPDSPLLDYVADVRASTPTDAASKLVPDFEQELNALNNARQSVRRTISQLITRESASLNQLRARPVLATPDGFLIARREDLLNNRRRIRVHITNVVLHATTQLAHTRDIVRALSPGFTLERGYAIVQGPDRHIIRDSSQLNPEDVVHVRVASGSFSATVNQITAKDPA